jgi:diguanylate cyclase (GGDEF)-like protein/PAS domain S-box-containing protein
MSSQDSRNSASTRARIENRLGFVPPLLEPALASPDLLESLWVRMRDDYLDNPLPAEFKERLFAYLALTSSVPHALVVHSCALHELGFSAAEILELLETPAPLDGLPAGLVDELDAVDGPLEAWPERGSKLDSALLWLAVVVFLEPAHLERAKAELRRLLGPHGFAYASQLLAYIWSSLLWLEAHPEPDSSRDECVRRNLPALLEAEPGLEHLFAAPSERVQAERERHAAELAANLRSSESRYRALVETAVDAIVSVDSEGAISDFNGAAEQLFGYSAEEVIGRPVTILMPERQRPRDGADLSRSLAAQAAPAVGRTVEVIGRRRDGREVPMEISLGTWQTDGRVSFTGVARDVSERRRQEEELQEARERFAGAFDQAAIGMALVAPDGRWLQVNESISEMLGYDREELLDGSFQDITHPADLDADLELVKRALEGEIEGYEMEKRYIHADGHVVWALLSVSLVRDRAGEPLYFISQVQDITDRKRSIEELGESERRFRALTEAAPVGIVEADAQGRCLYVNDRWCELSGQAAEAARGEGWLSAIHPVDREQLTDAWRAATRSGEELTLECRLRRPGGDEVWVSGRGVALRDAESRVSGYLVSVADITDRKRAERRMARLALQDDLTGLSNRPAFYDALQGALRESRVAVLFIDVDDFKALNDRLGHIAGDRLLVGVGQLLRRTLRSEDFVARLGGDEFGVILADIADNGEPARVAERVLAGCESPVDIGESEIRVGLSIGIAISSGSADGVEEILRRADMAMYTAKATGKGCYQLAPGGETADAPRVPAPSEEVNKARRRRADRQRQEIEVLLQSPNGIYPVFQPLVALATGEVTGHEALSRFDHPTAQPPNAWFGQAHRFGLGSELEAKAISAALAAPGRPPQTFLSVNVSPTALASDQIQAALPPSLQGVVIEITENELIRDDSAEREAIAEARARGALLAVDDAGSGYAGLKQLVRLTPDLIKVDRELVDGVHRDLSKAALLEAFVGYAARLGAQVCAEGVEDLADLDVLTELGLAYAQGFGIARPAREWTARVPHVEQRCRERVTPKGPTRPQDFLAEVFTLGADPQPDESGAAAG